MTDARTAAIRAEIDRLHKLIIEYRDRCQSPWMDRFDRRIATLEWVLALPDPPDRRDEAMRLITEARDNARVKKEAMLSCDSLTWANIYEQQIRFADEILAAMKPQEPT